MNDCKFHHLTHDNDTCGGCFSEVWRDLRKSAARIKELETFLAEVVDTDGGLGRDGSKRSTALMSLANSAEALLRPSPMASVSEEPCEHNMGCPHRENPPCPSEACSHCLAPRGSDHGILCPAGRSDTPDEQRPNEALRELAAKAVEAQEARKGEDVDAWAERLAADSIAVGEAEYGGRTDNPDPDYNARARSFLVDYTARIRGGGLMLASDVGEFGAMLLRARKEGVCSETAVHPDQARVLKLLIQRVGGGVRMTEFDLHRANRFQIRWTSNGHTTEAHLVEDT